MITVNRKRIITLVLLIALIGALTSCSAVKLKDLKFGIVYSENIKTVDVAAAVDSLLSEDVFSIEQLNLATVSDNQQECYDACAAFAQQGCNAVIVLVPECTDMVTQAAGEYADTEFCLFAGEKTESTPYTNYHCFNFAFHEVRYVEGYLVGLKLSEMMNNGQITNEQLKIGYIADNNNAENISAYTAAYLGAKAANDDISFYVKFPDEAGAEDKTAKALIANGCKVICQQTNYDMVSRLCIENNINFTSFGVEKPDTELLITSPDCKLERYISYIADSFVSKQSITDSWCGGLGDNAFDIEPANDDSFYNRAEVEEKAAVVIAELSNKTLHVFDNDTWTVNFEKIESALSEDGTGIEYVSPEGYFMEGELSPNPTFTYMIDGITILS